MRLNNDPHHPLVQQVKSNCVLQDDNPARLYTQQATGFLRENATNDPQGQLTIWQFRWGEGSMVVAAAEAAI
jgi:hypothetical protein